MCFQYFSGLKIQRMALTSGTSPVDYLKAFNITLFLATKEKDVKEALRRGKKDLFSSSSFAAILVGFGGSFHVTIRMWLADYI